MGDDIGLQATVPGEYIAAASHKLPNAEVATQQLMEVVDEVPGFGAVRFTFKRFCHHHGRSYHWFWTIQSAVKVADETG